MMTSLTGRTSQSSVSSLPTLAGLARPAVEVWQRQGLRQQGSCVCDLLLVEQRQNRVELDPGRGSYLLRAVLEWPGLAPVLEPVPPSVRPFHGPVVVDHHCCLESLEERPSAQLGPHLELGLDQEQQNLLGRFHQSN